MLALCVIILEIPILLIPHEPKLSRMPDLSEILIMNLDYQEDLSCALIETLFYFGRVPKKVMLVTKLMGVVSAKKGMGQILPASFQAVSIAALDDLSDYSPRLRMEMPSRSFPTVNKGNHNFRRVVNSEILLLYFGDAEIRRFANMKGVLSNFRATLCRLYRSLALHKARSHGIPLPSINKRLNENSGEDQYVYNGLSEQRILITLFGEYPRKPEHDEGK